MKKLNQSLTFFVVLFICLCVLFVTGCESGETAENSSLVETSSETSSISGGYRVETSSKESSAQKPSSEAPSFNESSKVSSSASSSSSSPVLLDSHGKDGRTLVWSDEFDGAELNAQKWHFSRTMGANDRHYSNNRTHAYIENGTFIMKAFRSAYNRDKFTLPEGLNTKNTMNFKYGYVEMRAKIPMRQGAWPSFWMLSDTVFQTADWMSEIDIFECFGHDSDLYVALHKHGGKVVGSHALPATNSALVSGSRIYTFAGDSGNDAYHIYGLEWNTNELKFSIDNKIYATIKIDNDTVASWGDPIKNANGFHDFHYIIMNNELLTEGGWYKHSKDSRVNDLTVFPVTYTIDYVRLYQKAGEELKLKSDIDAAS